MKKNVIDDRAIAKPPYTGPKKEDKIEDKEPSGKQVKAMLSKLFPDEEVRQAEELEESIALALQNYRSGLIDVDDLVAFLVPARLEEQGDAT